MRICAACWTGSGRGASEAGAQRKGELMEQFEVSFESLTKYRCPEWFRDAKFGIWSHWGPQSVPMAGDWYARNMYLQGTPQYTYHVRHYGHPSRFGYKDLCALWKAERFDPDALAELYKKAGAKYLVAQAVHHDNFFNFRSAPHRFNSVEMGPGMDICGLWKQAADKAGLRFGVSEHLAPSFVWWNTNKGADRYGPYKGVPYDGSDPRFAALYHKNQEAVVQGGEPGERRPGLTRDPEFQNHWETAMRELIDQYEPDLLCSDSGLPFGSSFPRQADLPDEPYDSAQYAPGLRTVARLYNSSIRKYGRNEAVYTQKDQDELIRRIGLIDIERTQFADICEQPWQTETCIGEWSYDERRTYKQPGHIIEIFVDIISKNGSMLLSILQRPDGSLDEETRYILEELSKWFAVCGEAVYGTRPFRRFGEGTSRAVITDVLEARTPWTEQDFRFVQKAGCLYAFVMKAPRDGRCVLRSLLPEERVSRVSLLGCGEVPFSQQLGILTVRLPEHLPTDYVNALKIEFSPGARP